MELKAGVKTPKLINVKIHKLGNMSFKVMCQYHNNDAVKREFLPFRLMYPKSLRSFFPSDSLSI